MNLHAQYAASSLQMYRSPAAPLSLDYALIVARAAGTPMVTVHPIKDKVLQAGQPLSRPELANLLSQIEPEDLLWNDTRLIASSRSTIAWWLPPAIRPQWFAVGRKTLRCMAPWPGLVLRMNRCGAFTVHAATGRERPEPGAKLFHAPLMNIDRTGAMCFGSAERPAFGAEYRDAFEAALIESRFSHVNHEHTLRIGKAGSPVDNVAHMAFWRDLEASGAAAFPAKALAPASMTLRDLLEAKP